MLRQLKIPRLAFAIPCSVDRNTILASLFLHENPYRRFLRLLKVHFTEVISYNCSTDPSTMSYRNRFKQNRPDYQVQLQDYRWRAKRATILNRDGSICQHCGSPHRLHVHHKEYAGDFRPPWEYDDDEMVTLCAKCHENLHQRENAQKLSTFWEQQRLKQDQLKRGAIETQVEMDRARAKQVEVESAERELRRIEAEHAMKLVGLRRREALFRTLPIALVICGVVGLIYWATVRRPITPEQAANFVGKTVAVEGRISEVYVHNSKNYLLLHFGGKYPNQQFTVYVKQSLIYKPGLSFWENLEGKLVKVEGFIERRYEKPQISLKQFAGITKM